MRCFECSSDNIMTDENGYKICSDCGLVIEDQARLESSYSISLNNTPICPTTIIGTSISKGHFNNPHLADKLRRTQGYLQQQFYRERDGFFQIIRLKNGLDIEIDDYNIINEYKIIAQKVKQVKVNPKTAASVIFYIIFKKFKINFDFQAFLGLTGLNRHKFWKYLQKFTQYCSNDINKIRNEDSANFFQYSELTRLTEEFRLPAKVVDLSQKYLNKYSFSSIPRISVGVAVFLSLKDLKNRGELMSRNYTLAKMWKFLKVSASTIYANAQEVGLWQIKKGPRRSQKTDLSRFTVHTNPVATAIAVENQGQGQNNLGTLKTKLLNSEYYRTKRIQAVFNPFMAELVKDVQNKISLLPKFAHNIKGKSKIQKSTAFCSFYCTKTRTRHTSLLNYRSIFHQIEKADFEMYEKPCALRQIKLSQRIFGPPEFLNHKGIKITPNPVYQRTLGPPVHLPRKNKIGRASGRERG